MEPFSNWDAFDTMIATALEEDIGSGDVTTDSMIPAGVSGEGKILCKQKGILAGLPVFFRVFETFDPNVRCEALSEDGSAVESNQILGTVRGSMRSLLKGERTALNFLQRLSGIATLTNAYVRAVDGTGVKILDTRKTTPSLRILEKYAVRAGGGENHRYGLFDMVLVKNNHADAAGGISQAIERCMAFLNRRGMDMKIEVETRTLEEVDEALRFPIHRIMLDNMGILVMREAVRLVHGRVETEASGNVGLENVRSVAESGVDYVSVGALTHSAPALDISFKIEVIQQESFTRDNTKSQSIV
jgi:nicotinate-nucleotide pyrophosphorylase (carboxylating)